MMKKMKNSGVLHGAVLAACALFLMLGLLTDSAQAPETNEPALELTPPPAALTAEQGERIAASCEIIQTMGFSRCGHSVTRRVSPPAALIGADFAAAQAYYDLWQLDSFSGEQVTMSREIPLFCPIHTVAGVNEAGEVVLSRNMYGDGMAVVKACDRELEDFSPEDQEALALGLGFDTQEAAEAWLREH